MLLMSSLILRSAMRLVLSLVEQPASTVTTLLYYSDLLPRHLNLERLVLRELLDRDNYLFHFLTGILRCFWYDLFTQDYFKEEAEVQEHKEITQDKDGDLVVMRRSKPVACHFSGDVDMCSQSHCFNVIIKHCIKSTIPAVGLQVWKAELALSDFVLHSIYTSPMLDEVISIELGAGTGLVGMLVAGVAKTVFLTDCGDKVLDNCYENVQLNSRTLKYNAKVCVRELDWLQHWPPKVDKKCSNLLDRYSWTCSEVEEAEDASILFAADVIYSDDLTDALFSALERLMSRGLEKVLYLALEKRYNFSLNDMDIVANGYSCFLSYVRNEDGSSESETSLPSFVGKHIDLAKVPQYVVNYNRGEDVEIWEIKYVRARS